MADETKTTTTTKKTKASGGPGDPILDHEQATEAGWFGSRPQVFDDSEFALTTGPESPGAVHVPIGTPDTPEFSR